MPSLPHAVLYLPCRCSSAFCCAGADLLYLPSLPPACPLSSLSSVPPELYDNRCTVAAVNTAQLPLPSVAFSPARDKCNPTRQAVCLHDSNGTAAPDALNRATPIAKKVANSPCNPRLDPALRLLSLSSIGLLLGGDGSVGQADQEYSFGLYLGC